MASLYSEADLGKGGPMPSPVVHIPSPPPSRSPPPQAASPDQSNSAELVALSLLARFSDRQLPKASEVQWLVSDKDAPQTVIN